jgi:nitrite reductase/ring-hydroxylating ferredoxin subunit
MTKFKFSHWSAPNWRNTNMGYEYAMSSDDVPHAGATKIRLGSKSILLMKVQQEFRAVASRCPHLGVPLREADVDAQGVITCWFHGAKFSSVDGEVLRGPLSVEWRSGIPLGLGSVAAAIIPKRCPDLARYALEVRGREIWIDPHRTVLTVSS